jgi:hypothetical protein
MPVRLQNSSVSWENEPMKCEWFDGTGRILGNANELDTVIYGEDLRSAIDLVVADSKGNAATNTATVVLDQTPVKEYGVASSLHGVPAYVYEDDAVQPEIQLRATSPDFINFDVRTRLTLNSGSVITTNEVVNLIRSWGRLLLPQVRVGECVELEWQVAHGGVVLHEHKWVFDTAPFDKWPDNVNGLNLSRDGDGVTYIARLASFGSIRRLNRLSGAQPCVLLLDGFLAAESSPATPSINQNSSISTLLSQNGSAATGLNIDCRYVRLQDLESTDNNGGAGRLLAFTRLQNYLPADIVLLAPALDGYRFGETVADFERRLAALAGLLCTTSNTGLVLVIPPAFDILPGCGCKSEKSGAPCRHAAEVSQLAESVMRVADAYGLPVVDLYTIFRVAASDQTLVKDGYLTPSGIETAAAAITREICR